MNEKYRELESFDDGSQHTHSLTYTIVQWIKFDRSVNCRFNGNVSCEWIHRPFDTNEINCERKRGGRATNIECKAAFNR